MQPRPNERTRSRSGFSLATRIARTILQGPRSIWPPRSVDRDGWLQRHLRLSRSWRQPAPEETIAVYTDSTNNRRKRFLPPLLRWAQWDRLADLGRVSAGGDPWPVVQVRVGTIREWAKIAGFAQRLQRELRHPPLALNFSAKRGTPDLGFATAFSWLSVHVTNGLQTVDYDSPAIERDRLTALVLKGFKTLSEEMQPMRLRGWEEWYDTDPTMILPGRLGGWTWRYARPDVVFRRAPGPARR